VPPLLGTTEAQARVKLSELGLVPDVSFVSVLFGDPNDGRVIAQTPSQSVEVDAGSTVKLKVGKALPAPTTTPATTTTSTTTIPPTVTT
jgi:beta-lactam-binding protein with PASTA domain